MSQHSSVPFREAVTELRRHLDQEGVRSAIRYLNGVTPHRFTALFRFEGGTLRNLHLVDREDARVERSPDQAITESYCVYVRQTSERFVTESSLADARVTGHPKQQSVQSYCGVPLVQPDGTLFGTICHFDYDPIPFDEEEVMLLEYVGPYLMRAIEETDWRPDQGPGDAEPPARTD